MSVSFVLHASRGRDGLLPGWDHRTTVGVSSLLASSRVLVQAVKLPSDLGLPLVRFS
jgi:hypothetical protein